MPRQRSSAKDNGLSVESDQKERGRTRESGLDDDERLIFFRLGMMRFDGVGTQPEQTQRQVAEFDRLVVIVWRRRESRNPRFGLVPDNVLPIDGKEHNGLALPDTRYVRRATTVVGNKRERQFQVRSLDGDRFAIVELELFSRINNPSFILTGFGALPVGENAIQAAGSGESKKKNSGGSGFHGIHACHETSDCGLLVILTAASSVCSSDRFKGNIWTCMQ